ncbi:hypothetical protein GF358_04140 [Candidatus Woesearchaeota archaeon]|nr:hypothetical protein [Candidatus Woesearchaeota archaeon]
MDTYVAAILTDIHGKIKEMHRIFHHMKNLPGQVKDMFFLGDAIGYGPDQLKCFDILRRYSETFLPGNHEYMLKLLLAYPKKRKELLNAGVDERAVQTIETTINQLIGKTTLSAGRTKINLPAESYENLQKENYPAILAEELLTKIIPEINVASPEISWLKKQIPEDKMQQIGLEYTVKLFAKHPACLEEYRTRMKRRERAVDIFNFLDEINKEKTMRLVNAIFVHDDPLQPGSQKYLVDDETAKKLHIEPSNRVILSRINKKNFPGIEYIFVGHSHIPARIVDINGINIVYCGGTDPRGNPKKNSYVLAQIKQAKVSKVVPVLVS